jgi:hypothetical protein
MTASNNLVAIAQAAIVLVLVNAVTTTVATRTLKIMVV